MHGGVTCNSELAGTLCWVTTGSIALVFTKKHPYVLPLRLLGFSATGSETVEIVYPPM